MKSVRDRAVKLDSEKEMENRVKQKERITDAVQKGMRRQRQEERQRRERAERESPTVSHTTPTPYTAKRKPVKTQVNLSLVIIFAVFENCYLSPIRGLNGGRNPLTDEPNFPALSCRFCAMKSYRVPRRISPRLLCERDWPSAAPDIALCFQLLRSSMPAASAAHYGYQK